MAETRNGVEFPKTTERELDDTEIDNDDLNEFGKLEKKIKVDPEAGECKDERK